MKYKLTDSMYVGFTTLKRIESLADFKNVRKGGKGGFIEKESNLSQ